MTPQGLVKIMNHYLTTMSGPIHDHRGIIDKYIGDAIMAYWGPPFIDDGRSGAFRLPCRDRHDRPHRSLAEGFAGASRRARDAGGMRSAHRRRDRRGAGRQHRLGIHDELHGDGRHGESRPRVSRPPTSSTARTALSPRTRCAKPAPISRFREIDRVIVAGQSRAQVVFELMGRARRTDAAAGPVARPLCRRACGLSRAATSTKRAPRSRPRSMRRPGDGPSAALLSRIEEFMQRPPDNHWDGAWRLDSK